VYKDFYHFRAEPFHITSDPAFLYLSPSHKEALGAIVYGIGQRKGFVAISGEVGVGKTTILRAYLEGADLFPRQGEQKVIYIFNANISFRGLLHTICKELDKVPPPAGQMYELVNFLQIVLIEQYQQGQTVVLVIDEAQNMPLETLENLRMLSNLETSREKLLQIVLVGQPEFEAMINRPQLRQLNQRIAIRARIQPLTRKESVEYLYHRLSKVTDAPSKAFSHSAIRLIARKGQGAPRILNILSDNALIAGFGYQIKPVTPAIVREAIADYQGRQSSKRLRWVMLPIALGALLIVLSLTPEGKNQFLHLDSLVRSFSSRGETIVEDSASKFASGPRFMATSPVETLKQAPPVDSVPESKPVRYDKDGPMTPAPEKTISETSSQSGSQSRIDFSMTAKPIADPLSMNPADATSKGSQPIRRMIQKGDTLNHISLAVYGNCDPDTLKWIVVWNPQIHDINVLQEGDLLILPERPVARGQSKTPR
jgi:type II secretory pathway predicted ATPase ExeA